MEKNIIVSYYPMVGLFLPTSPNIHLWEIYIPHIHEKVYRQKSHKPVYPETKL